MDIVIDVNKDNLEIDKTTFQKMCFVFNALNDGWSIKKNGNSYIFVKKHEGRREVFSDDYLAMFMKEQSNINKLLC